MIDLDEARRAIQSADHTLATIPSAAIEASGLRLVVLALEGDLIDAWVATGGVLTNDDEIPAWTPDASVPVDWAVDDAKDGAA